MSVAKIEAHIDAIERKLTKSIKIAEKGASMKLGDVAKLGQKTNSIVSEINKSIKEYDVSPKKKKKNTNHMHTDINIRLLFFRAPNPPPTRPSACSPRWRRSSP